MFILFRLEINRGRLRATYAAAKEAAPTFLAGICLSEECVHSGFVLVLLARTRLVSERPLDVNCAEGAAATGGLYFGVSFQTGRGVYPDAADMWPRGWSQRS